MYKTVKNVVDSANSWTGFTAFEAAYTAFGSKLTQLENFAYNQTLALVGVKTVKEAKRTEAAKFTLEVAASLAAFASTTGNVELRERMKISPSKLKYGAAHHSLQLIDLVIEKATLHLNDLGDFGVDQAKLTALINKRDQVNIVFNAPRQAIVDRKVMTAKMDELVLEIDRILREQLDKLMLILDPQDHEFFLSYNAARVIVDHKAHHASADDESEEEEDESNDSDYEE